jgi:hypothetical protein
MMLLCYEELDMLRETVLDEAYFLEQGYVAVRQVGDEWLGVLPMTFGKGRLCSGLSFCGHEDLWCYESLPEALAAMHAWNPENEEEPTGWFRHPITGRRRPNGDSLQEYVAR